MGWNPFSTRSSTRTRALASALAGFVAYGGWAYFVNVGHGDMVGMRSGLVQGGYSFILTMSSAYLMEFVYRWFRKTLDAVPSWIPTLLVTMVILFATAWGINRLAGTPRILLTILPGFLIGSLFSLVYILNLKRLQASEQVP